MKNKNQFLSMCIMVLACVFVFTSCKKKETGTADPNAKQHNEDVSNTKSESDNLNTDINNVIKDSGFGKKEGTQATIEGCAIDLTHQGENPPYVVFTFDGTAHGNPLRKREGVIKVTLINGTHWSQAGAVLEVKHEAYKVTFVNLNNHYLIFNGTKYLTNLYGITYPTLTTFTETIKERSNDMRVTFENGQEETWNCARRTTLSGTFFPISAISADVIVEADSIDGTRKIDSWGKTRFGTNFTTEMITSWKSGTHCGWWKPTQGKYTSTTDNFSITATASVDQEGNVVTTDCGGYGYKLEWNYNSGTATGNVVIPYF